MYGFTEYEIIRILEERNDFEYIDSKSKEYEEEYKRIAAKNKARIMRECRSFHRQLSKPIPEDYLDEFIFDSKEHEMYDEVFSNWCNNCTYISKCNIRITERWNNSGELLGNEK